jgi:hypothetical protein
MNGCQFLKKTVFRVINLARYCNLMEILSYATNCSPFLLVSSDENVLFLT